MSVTVKSLLANRPVARACINHENKQSFEAFLIYLTNEPQNRQEFLSLDLIRVM